MAHSGSKLSTRGVRETKQGAVRVKSSDMSTVKLSASGISRPRIEPEEHELDHGYTYRQDQV